jgi:hypothetical protein
VRFAPLAGGLTTGSTRPLDSFSFKVESSDDGRRLLARGGLSGALGVFAQFSYNLIERLVFIC